MGISSALSATGAVPVGVVNPFAGSVAPANWLLCFGQNVSRTQYVGLFLTIGTTYGAGDGSTTFALPDMRGRAVAGKDDMGGSAANRITAAVTGVSGITLGNAGGTQDAPLHSHTINHDHGVFNTTGGEGNHTHYTQGGAFGGSTPYLSGWNTEGAMRESSTAGAHNHSIDMPNFTGSSGNAGTGTAANLQPTIILNYIIKAQ